MRVEKIALNGFRNYEWETAEFSPGTNVICGPNAQGKTNLLEAVYMLSCGRSFRTRFDRELIGFGYSEGQVLAEKREDPSQDETQQIDKPRLPDHESVSRRPQMETCMEIRPFRFRSVQPIFRQGLFSARELMPLTLHTLPLVAPLFDFPDYCDCICDFNIVGLDIHVITSACFVHSTCFQH